MGPNCYTVWKLSTGINNLRYRPFIRVVVMCDCRPLSEGSRDGVASKTTHEREKESIAKDYIAIYEAFDEALLHLDNNTQPENFAKEVNSLVERLKKLEGELDSVGEFSSSLLDATRHVLGE